MEKLINIAIKERSFTNYFLIIAALIGGTSWIISINIWNSKVQPAQDQLAYLQIEKLKREINVLDKQLNKSE